MTTQAIAGVSSTTEAVIMTEYPSVGSLGPAKMLGKLYESMPSPLGLPKVSYLFALRTKTAPHPYRRGATRRYMGQDGLEIMGNVVPPWG